MTKHRGEYILVIAVVVFLVIVGMLTGCDRSLQKENERLREELAKAQQYVPLHRDTIRDTVEVVTQKVVEVVKIKEVLTDEDRVLLKDAGIAAKELMSLQKTGMETKDSVNLSVKDSTKEDSPLYYKDAWAEFEFHNKRLKYSVKDSLAIAVKKEYKHRFLWWKWGTKGYEVKVVNFNPHSTIRYNTFVKRKE
jgi:hypothetical protein